MNTWFYLFFFFLYSFVWQGPFVDFQMFFWLELCKLNGIKEHSITFYFSLSKEKKKFIILDDREKFKDSHILKRTNWGLVSVLGPRIIKISGPAPISVPNIEQQFCLTLYFLSDFFPFVFLVNKVVPIGGIFSKISNIFSTWKAQHENKKKN